MAKTRKYVLLDELNTELYAERGSACEICGRTLVPNKSGEWAHTKPTDLKGEGRGRFERLHDVQTNPDKYLLACEKCHDQILDKRNYKRNIRALSPEASSRAVKRAMKVAGVSHTTHMKGSIVARAKRKSRPKIW